MPAISEKGKKMPESPIRKLVPYAEEAKRLGKRVYHLNIGQPDIKTPGEVGDRIRAFDLDVIEYSHSAGIESYRKGIADYYNKLGLPIDFTDVLVTTGGSEALIFSLLSCFDTGDEIIVPEPFYSSYNSFASFAGVNIKPITSTLEKGFSLPKREEFEVLITPKTKGILISNPGNPTGNLYTREELEELKKIVKDHDLFLIADEVYREFCYDGHQHISCLSLEGIEEHTILVDSVSKRYSMCGVRVGALITRNKEVIATALKFAQARLSPPALGQLAGEAALSTPQSYFDEVLNEYAERRKVVVRGLNNIEGVKCLNPGGAFYTIAKLPVEDAEEFCKWLLQEFSYEGQTVMLAPAAGFYATPGLGKQEVRVAFVLNVTLLRKTVKCLEEALKVYPGLTKEASMSELN